MNTLSNQGNQPHLRTLSRRKAASSSFSLSKLWALAYRQRWVLIACIGGALLIGALITFLSRPEYTALASVQLDQQSATILSSEGIEPEVPVQESERFLQTQLDRILSRTTAEGVAQSLNISENPLLIDALGLEADEASPDRILEELQDGVTAALGLNTRLAQISFTSHDARASADIANAFAEHISSSDLLSRSETAIRAEQYLEEQLAEARANLQNSENAMLAYARNADLTTTVVAGNGTGGDRGGSLRAQQLGQLTDSLANATANRIAAEQTWRQVESLAPLAIPQVQDNRAIQELVSERASLDGESAEQRGRYTSEFPGVTGAAARREVIDSEIAQLAEEIKRSYRTNYIAAQRAERQLQGTVEQLRRSAMAERERAVNYNALQREVDTNRAFYDGLLQRYQEVAAASGAPGEAIRIVDRAEPPRDASSPNPVRNLALSGILGLIAALGLGVLRERSSNVVRSADDAEKYLGVSPLGAVPTFGKGDTQDSVILDPRSPQSEAYYSASVALHRMNPDRPSNMVLVTSCTPGEGKTTSSIAIAKSFATMGKRTLLIDGDLRRPSLGMMLNHPIGDGLGEVLSGKSQLENTIVSVNAHGIDLLTSGNHGGDPVGLLSADKLGPVLIALKDQYDKIVIDGPPVMGIADSVLISEFVDACAFIIEANSKDVEEIQAAITRFPEDLPIGAIVTKFDARIAGVKYGRQSYYSY